MKVSQLAPLTIEDKPLIDKYLSEKHHELSSYNFISLYIWKDAFDFFYSIIDENLCIFARNKIGIFMYLAPQGKHPSEEVIKDCFRIMDEENNNSGVSRIENIEKDEVGFYESTGLKIIPKDKEYLCKRKSLSDLSGDKFKPKRALSNYFLKNYEFIYEDFKPEFKDECLKLYERWQKKRQDKYTDPIFRQMLKDSFSCHKIAMENFQNLGLKAKVLKVKDKICGYTFGYSLNKETFCVLFEITDLDVKGAAQFIFKEFCSELDSYDYINIMDDSGLENLRKVKLSYQPFREIEAFIAQKNV